MPVKARHESNPSCLKQSRTIRRGMRLLMGIQAMLALFLRRIRMMFPSRHRCLLALGIVSLATAAFFLFLGFDLPPWLFARKTPCMNAMSEENIIISEGAKRLPTNGSLFCFVVTSTKYHATRVPAVNTTWLPKCDHGEFFTSFAPHADRETEDACKDCNFSPSSFLPFSTVFNGIPDKYELLFRKTLAALAFVYEKYPDFDWYYKADDDTFVVVEHLKQYLSILDPAKSLYIGYRMRPYLEHGYNGGGAGYVISRAALRIFNGQLLHNRTLCPLDRYEDVGVGRCFASVGIFPHDARNEKGQQRFNTYNAGDIFHKTVGDEWIYDPQIPGFDAMAPELISLHHLSPDEIRTYYQLIYKVGRHLAKTSP